MSRGYPLPADAQPPVRGAHAPAPGQPLANHYDGCFACGADHADGLHLTATAEEGVAVRSHVRITAAHQGAPGLAHGGIIAAVMDETLGFLLWLLGTAGVTGKLELTYRAPVPIDSDVYGDAECTGIAGRKIFTAGSLRLGAVDGPVVAEASGLFVQVGADHFAPYLGGERDGQIGAMRRQAETPRYNP